MLLKPSSATDLSCAMPYNSLPVSFSLCLSHYLYMHNKIYDLWHVNHLNWPSSFASFAHMCHSHLLWEPSMPLTGWPSCLETVLKHQPSIRLGGPAAMTPFCDGTCQNGQHTSRLQCYCRLQDCLPKKLKPIIVLYSFSLALWYKNKYQAKTTEVQRQRWPLESLTPPHCARTPCVRFWPAFQR